MDNIDSQIWPKRVSNIFVIGISLIISLGGYWLDYYIEIISSMSSIHCNSFERVFHLEMDCSDFM